jgi:hypothetical protein
MKQFIGTMLLGLAVTAIPCAAQITGGNPAVAAPYTDGWVNFTVVDQNNPISGAGTLDAWNVYTSGIGQVELVIVAPTTYDIVGTSSVETTTTGLNNFTLSTPISVAAGDYVGFWEGDPSSVVFAAPGSNIYVSDTSQIVLFTNNGSGTPTSPLSFVGSGDRVYSINVSGPAVSAPEGGAGFMYLLLAGAACFGAVVFGSRKGKASAFQA